MDKTSSQLNMDSAAADARSLGKARYSKPSFRHEKVFETMALACGKINATQAQCRTSRKAS